MFYSLAVLTFGTAVPAGQFVPGIMIGSTYGRLVGMFVVKFYNKLNVEEGTWVFIFLIILDFECVLLLMLDMIGRMLSVYQVTCMMLQVKSHLAGSDMLVFLALLIMCTFLIKLRSENCGICIKHFFDAGHSDVCSHCLCIIQMLIIYDDNLLVPCDWAFQSVSLGL